MATLPKRRLAPLPLAEQRPRQGCCGAAGKEAEGGSCPERGSDKCPVWAVASAPCLSGLSQSPPPPHPPTPGAEA